MKLVFAIFFLALVVPGLGGSDSAPGNVLFCDICVDIVTDIDQFLVSDPTEQAVIEFVSQVRHSNIIFCIPSENETRPERPTVERFEELKGID